MCADILGGPGKYAGVDSAPPWDTTEIDKRLEEESRVAYPSLTREFEGKGIVFSRCRRYAIVRRHRDYELIKSAKPLGFAPDVTGSKNPMMCSGLTIKVAIEHGAAIYGIPKDIWG